MSVKAAYRFRSGALSTDHSGNGNTLTVGSGVTAVNSPTRGGAQYDGTSNGYSHTPFNGTRANMATFMTFVRIDGTAFGAGSGGYPTIYDTKGSEERMLYLDGGNWYGVRYPSAYINPVPMVLNKWYAYCSRETTVGADLRSEVFSPMSASGGQAYSSVGAFTMGSGNTGGTSIWRQATVSFAETIMMTHEASWAEFSNYKALHRGFI